VFKQTWIWIAAALAFLALGAVALKRRRPPLAPLEELDAAAAPARIEPELKAEPVPVAAAAKARPASAPIAPIAPAAASSDTGTFEITGTFRPVDFDTGTEQTTAESEYPFSDSGSALAIDQADPISEADFHMAYGLYDQASELVRKALEREPGRQDLQLKLLEILFVWGNKEVFRKDAQAFRADLARSGQWDKIVIMGRQICPGDALFDGGDAAPSDAGVDLDLASSAKMAAPIMPTAVDEAPTLDFDLDDALTARADLHSAETVPATGEYLELQSKDKGEEVEVHDEALTEVARRLEARMRPRAGDVGVALDLGETIAPEDVSATRTLSENKPKKADDDAFGDFFAFTGVAEAPEPDPTGTREVVLDFEGDMLPDSTTAEFKIELPDDGSGVDLDIGQTGIHTTKLSATLGGDTTTMLTPGGDTTIVSSFGDDTETVQSPGFVDPTARTVQAPRPIGFGRGGDETVQADQLDLDVGFGAADDRGSTLRVSPSDLALPDAQDGVLDEVGTKLDLARAYIDMGDPDGARSILAEVIEEGDESQRQNAHTLLRSIA
jgi:pilus assembly protein FimV